MPQTKIWQTSSQRWSSWRWWTNTKTSSTCWESVRRMVSFSSASPLICFAFVNILLENQSDSECVSWSDPKPGGYDNDSSSPVLHQPVPPPTQGPSTCWWSMLPRAVWGSTCGPGDLQAWITPLMWPRYLRSSSPSKTFSPVPTRWPEGWNTWPLKGCVHLKEFK